MHVNATSKWNRLFAVIAVCWAIVAPLLLAAEADRRPELARRDCTETSYRLYGATDSPRFDVNRYAAEADACNRSYNSDSVRLPEVLSAMVALHKPQGPTILEYKAVRAFEPFAPVMSYTVS